MRGAWTTALLLFAVALPCRVTAAQSIEPAPSTADRIVPAADLRADAELLERAYRLLHPGLHRYRTAAGIDEAFAGLRDAFARDRTLGDAYLEIARVTAYVQCGHSYPNFYNQSKDVAAALLEPPRLPFDFRWLGRRMVVTRSHADSPYVIAGTEVLKIGERPVGEILDGLMPYSRADGANDAKRVSNLEAQGRGQYEAFDVYFPLRFPKEAQAPFALQVRTRPGEAPRTIAVEALAPGRRQVVSGAPRGDANPWATHRLAPGIEYLRMSTWALYNSTFDWQRWLDGYFAGLVADGVEDLIIDLRDNEGGLAVGDRLLSHLAATDLPAQPIERRTRYRKVPDDLVPHLDTWAKEFYDWGPRATDLGDGYFRLANEDGDAADRVRPVEPRFAGRVWVLVGPVNSSATFEFASAVQQHRLGTLVGQPTGGNQRGITGGAYFFLRLPRTGIEVDVPFIGQFPVGDTLRPNAGLVPDIVVEPTIEDIAGGRDAELEAVLGRKLR